MNHTTNEQDSQCICIGNWRLLVNQYIHLVGRRFTDRHGDIYVFFGLVHGEEDYYFGMTPITPSRVMLLSCVGDFESHGFRIVDEY